MRDATVRLAVAANNIANASTEGFKPSGVVTAELPGGGVESTVVPGHLDGVDLAGEIVSMMVAKVAFAANAKILSTMFEMDRRAVDRLA